MNKPKLLLADDSVTIRKVVELTFADEGIDVSTAADAAAAMQRFVDIQPDIVLVDVGLDGTNGYQICEMIKADEATKHIPVLLLVGSFEPFDQAEAERVNADGFLTKPFHSIRDLVARVWDLLGRGSSVPEIEADSAQEDLPPVPTFGDAFTEDIPASDEPESDDIGDLYRSSFAETVKIEELGTVEDLLGDSGMDDEMIETNHVSPPPEHSFADLAVERSPDVEMKEFDWSPQSLVSASSPLEESPEAEPESLVVGELPQEDFLSDLFEEDTSSLETVEISNESGLVAETETDTADIDDDVELFDELDFRITPSDTPTVQIDAEVPNEDLVDPAIHDTIPYAPGDQPPVADVVSSPEMLSAELIEKIAQRVIERLSDSVVREIAKEEVPRIAEKLIREALEQEG